MSQFYNDGNLSDVTQDDMDNNEQDNYYNILIIDNNNDNDDASARLSSTANSQQTTSNFPGLSQLTTISVQSNMNNDNLDMLSNIFNAKGINSVEEFDKLNNLNVNDDDNNIVIPDIETFMEKYICDNNGINTNIFSDEQLLDEFLLDDLDDPEIKGDPDKIDDLIAIYYNKKKDILTEVVLEHDDDDDKRQLYPIEEEEKEEVKEEEKKKEDDKNVEHNKKIDEIGEIIIEQEEVEKPIQKKRQSTRVKENQANIEKIKQIEAERKKIAEDKRKEETNNFLINTEVQSLHSGQFSNSQCSSQFLLNLSDKIELNPNHFSESAENGPKKYSDLFNICCRLRHLPAINQGDSRDLSSLRIAEKTQFSDIWGSKMLKYARYEESDGLNYNDLGAPLCYITKTPLVPFNNKAVISGKSDKMRSCSEMEHKLPCVTAFSRAPNYVLLSKYKPIRGKPNYLKLWNDYVNKEEKFKNLYELYKLINFENFNEQEITSKEVLIYTDFQVYITITERIVIQSYDIFKWVFNVIKYWLHEFAYSHHISNQEKSIHEIALNKRECTGFLNKLKITWSVNGRNSGAAIVERKSIGAQVTKKLENGKEKENLKNSLMDQFDYMKRIIGDIDKTYEKITRANLTQLIDSTSNTTIDQCKKILIMKNMLLAYKLHKKASSSSKKPKNVSSSSSKKPKNNKKDKSANELVELAEKYVEANKKIVKRGSKKKKKGKKGGTKKRVRFKVSRKVYRKLEHK